MFAIAKVAVWNPNRAQFHTQQTPLELRARVVVDANEESTRVPVHGMPYGDLNWCTTGSINGFHFLVEPPIFQGKK